MRLDKWALSVIIVLFTACGGGDSGSTTATNTNGSSNPTTASPAASKCTVDIAAMTNGNDAKHIDSAWLCTASNHNFAFAFYDDGTGESTDVGPFTWQENSCGVLSVASSIGQLKIDQIAGSLISGIFTFRQTNADGLSAIYSCKISAL